MVQREQAKSRLLLLISGFICRKTYIYIVCMKERKKKLDQLKEKAALVARGGSPLTWPQQRIDR